MRVSTDGPAISLAELLSALSFVADLGMGQILEHGIKAAYVGLALADAVGLSPEDQAAVYYGALLKDAGCTHLSGNVASEPERRLFPVLAT